MKKLREQQIARVHFEFKDGTQHEVDNDKAIDFIFENIDKLKEHKFSRRGPRRTPPKTE